MGKVILCTTRRAEKPLFIRHVGLSIYSVEELCYYMDHNLYLLDETLLNTELLGWMKDELHMRRLALKLSQQLHGELSISAFILPIFKEISYFDREEYKDLNERIDQMLRQPPLLRRKLKGDALMHHGKYLQAIQVYQQILGDLDNRSIGSQILGSIYHNLGCAFAYLFEAKEAEEMFREANERLHTSASQRSLLFGTYLAEGREAYEVLCTQQKIAPEEKKAMDERILTAIKAELPPDTDAALDEWIADYHHSTGL